MDNKLLTPVLSVSAQISVADLAAIAQAGFKSIICNRPDGEGADQTGFKEIEQAAQAAGLQARYLPAETGKVTDEQGAAFGQLMDELPKPVLAYCRSGTRSIVTWAIGQMVSGEREASELIALGTAAGYDLSSVLRR